MNAGRYAVKYGKVASGILKKQMAELPIGAVSMFGVFSYHDV